MGFKCGIVGLPNVGKSTLFNALTQTAAAQAANYPFCTIEPNVGDVAVPDPRIEALAAENRGIHERKCFNLNPATNVMNPRAEALLASGIGSRPSLGYPGDKYEMGLEAIEEIEVICAELCAEVFDAKYAEIRVPSGAIANLFGFMAICQPGDTIIAPPPKSPTRFSGGIGPLSADPMAASAPVSEM